MHSVILQNTFALLLKLAILCEVSFVVTKEDSSLRALIAFCGNGLAFSAV